MSKLLPDQRERLAKILGMLGSAHDGEVAAAGRAAHELVTSAGLTWQAVFEGAPAQSTRPPWIAPTVPLSTWYGRTQRIFIEYAHVCDVETARFILKLMSLGRRQKPIAPKDADRLDGLYRRLFDGG